MKKLSLLLTAVAGLCTASIAQVGPVPGCPGAFGPTKLIVGNATKLDTASTIRLPGGTVTWVKDTIYIIKGLVRVASATTLQLRPGTIVMGFPGPLDTSALIFKPGSKARFAGLVDNPVVLTSCKIQGARNRGDWGGLVICGNAVTNLGTNVELEGGYRAYYGGNDPEDNSGLVQYTRVEFAGMAFAPNRELNGITLAGVGAKTVFQFVEVSNANDDSFEWFGGSVNGKNLISYKGIDDDFDTDNGYNGLNQFGISYRDFSTADFSGSNSFESDNDANGDVSGGTLLTPKTDPTFTNFSLYGPIKTSTTPYNRFFKTGALLRRNTETDIYNSLFVGWPGDSTVADGVQGSRESSGVFISGANAASNASTGAIRFKKNIVTAYNVNPTNPATDNNASFNAVAWFQTSAFGNVFTNSVFTYTGSTPFLLRDNPDFRNNPGATILTGSSFSTASLSSDLPVGNLFALSPPRGFSSVPYRGATSTQEWAQPWAEYNPNLFKYTAGTVPTRKGAMDQFLSGNEGVSVNSVVIMPNPAVSNTELQFIMENETPDAAVTVLDMNGNVMFSKATGIISGVNNIPLNTSSLEPGIYIVRVSANGTVSKTAKLNVVR